MLVNLKPVQIVGITLRWKREIMKSSLRNCRHCVSNERFITWSLMSRPPYETYAERRPVPSLASSPSILPKKQKVVEEQKWNILQQDSFLNTCRFCRASHIQSCQLCLVQCPRDSILPGLQTRPLVSCLQAPAKEKVLCWESNNQSSKVNL